MLIGKWADCHHRKINWAAKSKFASATNNLVIDELLEEKRAQKEKGRLIKRKEKDNNPNKITGLSNWLNKDRKEFSILKVINLFNQLT